MAEQEHTKPPPYFSRENLEAACRHYDALAAAAPDSEVIAEQAAAVRAYVDTILNG